MSVRVGPNRAAVVDAAATGDPLTGRRLPRRLATTPGKETAMTALEGRPYTFTRPYRLAGPAHQAVVVDQLTDALLAAGEPVQARCLPAEVPLAAPAQGAGRRAGRAGSERAASSGDPTGDRLESLPGDPTGDRLESLPGDPTGYRLEGLPGDVSGRSSGGDWSTDWVAERGEDPASRLAVGLARQAFVRSCELWGTPEALAGARRALTGSAVEVGEPVSATAEFPAVRDERWDQLRLEDGQLARVFGLCGWPDAAPSGWTSELLAATRGTRAQTGLVVHVIPLPAGAAGDLLRRRANRLHGARLAAETSGSVVDPELTRAADSARQLWGQVSGGATRLVAVQVLFWAMGPDEEALAAASAALCAAAAARLARLRVLHFVQAPAWAALAAGASALSWPLRLLDTVAAAAALPHPCGPPGTGSGGVAAGVLAGRERESGAPVYLDRFALHNPGRLVLGTSGSGKSYLAKLELLRWLAAGVPAVVVDPEAEFTPIARAVGGVVVAPGAEPAGLDPVGLACAPWLAPAEGVALLASFAAALGGQDLSPRELAALDTALVALRQGGGASPSEDPSPPRPEDLRSLAGPGVEPADARIPDARIPDARIPDARIPDARIPGSLTHRPDLAELARLAGGALAERLAPAVSGSLAELFAPAPALDRPSPLTVFDLRAVPGRLRGAVTACVLAWGWARARGAAASTSGDRRQLLVVDEAHLLLSDPRTADLLAGFARRARKYQVALELVTQRLSDFLDNPCGAAILANTAVKCVLACEAAEAEVVARSLGLSAAEVELLRPGDPGRGLLLFPGGRVPLEVLAAESEHELLVREVAGDFGYALAPRGGAR